MRIIINTIMAVANIVGQATVGTAETLRYRTLSPVYQGLIALAAKLEAK
jgi:hypothetical protein